MKKLLIPLLLIGVVLLFTRTSCEKDKPDNNCGEIKTTIERSFTLSIMIKYKDNVPYQGNVRFKIYKKYCNGNISGEDNVAGKADVTGFWRPGNIYTYIFEDWMDAVHVEFYVTDPRTTTTDATISEFFLYHNVEDKPAGIKKTYQMTLPWNSEEK